MHLVLTGQFTFYLELLASSFHAFSNALQQNNQSFSVIDNLEDSLSAVAEKTADALIVETSIPNSKESNFLTKCKRINPQIKLVVLATSIDRKEEAELILAGADLCFTKPADLDESMAVFLFILSLLLPSQPIKNAQYKGISPHNFIELFQARKETGTLVINTPNGEGYINLVEGRIVDARLGDLVGDQAAATLYSSSQTRTLRFQRTGSARFQTVQLGSPDLLRLANDKINDHNASEGCKPKLSSPQQVVQIINALHELDSIVIDFQVDTSLGSELPVRPKAKITQRVAFEDLHDSNSQKIASPSEAAGRKQFENRSFHAAPEPFVINPPSPRRVGPKQPAIPSPREDPNSKPLDSPDFQLNLSNESPEQIVLPQIQPTLSPCEPVEHKANECESPSEKDEKNQKSKISEQPVLNLIESVILGPNLNILPPTLSEKTEARADLLEFFSFKGHVLAQRAGHSEFQSFTGFSHQESWSVRASDAHMIFERTRRTDVDNLLEIARIPALGDDTVIKMFLGSVVTSGEFKRVGFYSDRLRRAWTATEEEFAEEIRSAGLMFAIADVLSVALLQQLKTQIFELKFDNETIFGIFASNHDFIASKIPSEHYSFDSIMKLAEFISQFKTKAA